MDTESKTNIAREQLDRTLAFFSRTETKATALFAVNTGMFGVLALNTHPCIFFFPVMIELGLITFALLAISTCFLYRAFSPSRGSQVSESLAYFGHVANLTKEQYIEQWTKKSHSDHLEDLLDQIWSNSKILDKKFSYISYAFIFTIIALLPWLIFLTISSSIGQSALHW